MCLDTLCAGFMWVSVMGFTVFHKAVCDVVDLQQLLVILFLHFCVDCPGYHLHPPLGPVLDIVPADSTQTHTHTHLFSGLNNMIRELLKQLYSIVAQVVNVSSNSQYSSLVRQAQIIDLYCKKLTVRQSSSE